MDSLDAVLCRWWHWLKSDDGSAVYDAVARIYNVVFGPKSRIRGQGNQIRLRSAFLRGVTLDIVGNDNVLVVNRGSRLTGCTVFMRGSGHRLIVGQDCVLDGGRFLFEDDGCTITVGRNTTFAAHVELAATEPGRMISVGEDCMFANDIQVRTGDSHAIVSCATGRRINEARSVRIGDHVWVANRVTVLKGVSVGNGSVLGTGSVVTRHVPPNSIVSGVPAEVALTGVTWRRDRSNSLGIGASKGSAEGLTSDG